MYLFEKRQRLDHYCECGDQLVVSEYGGAECLECGEHWLICGACDSLQGFDDSDCLGACPGNVYCAYCSEEIDSSTGAKTGDCGNCRCCRPSD